MHLTIDTGKLYVTEGVKSNLALSTRIYRFIHHMKQWKQQTRIGCFEGRVDFNLIEKLLMATNTTNFRKRKQKNLFFFTFEVGKEPIPFAYF